MFSKRKNTDPRTIATEGMIILEVSAPIPTSRIRANNPSPSRNKSSIIDHTWEAYSSVLVPESMLFARICAFRVQAQSSENASSTDNPCLGARRLEGLDAPCFKLP